MEMLFNAVKQERTMNIANKRKLAIVALIFFINFGTGVMAADDEITIAIKSFSEFYSAELEKTGIVGSSFMLVHEDKIVYEEHHGFANKEKQYKADRNTIYHWASITKTFTGIAIMQLRDRGMLKLSDPITKYLPVLRGVHNEYGSMDDITIKHLLSHTSGFRGATWPWKNKEWHPHEPTKWEQLVAMIPYTEILFKPGSKWSYSNPGIIFLGEVIEQLSGDDYEVYIDKNIFKPLRMYNSYFDATPNHLLKHRCQSYWLKDGKLEAAPFDVDTGITVSNGGLNSPISDFVKYVKFLLNAGDSHNVYETVLKRSSLEEMFEPQIVIRDLEGDGNEKTGRRDSMALTYFIEENHGLYCIGHSGGQNAFVTHFYINPRLKTGYIVAFNTRAYSSIESNDHVRDTTSALDGKIRDFVFQKLFPLFDN